MPYENAPEIPLDAHVMPSELIPFPEVCREVIVRPDRVEFRYDDPPEEEKPRRRPELVDDFHHDLTEMLHTWRDEGLRDILWEPVNHMRLSLALMAIAREFQRHELMLQALRPDAVAARVETDAEPPELSQEAKEDWVRQVLGGWAS